jgi:hypothetical protein
MNGSIISVIANSESAGKLVDAATAYIYAEIIFGVIVLIAFCIIASKKSHSW